MSSVIFLFGPGAVLLGVAAWVLATGRLPFGWHAKAPPSITEIVSKTPDRPGKKAYAAGVVIGLLGLAFIAFGVIDLVSQGG